MSNITRLKQFCDQWLASWTGNKPDQLLTFYHQDAYYVDPANKNGLQKHAALQSYFKKLLAANPNWKWEAVELFETTNGFTLKWKATIPVKEQTLIEYGLDIIELKENKIIRNEVYFDRTDWFNSLKK